MEAERRRAEVHEGGQGRLALRQRLAARQAPARGQLVDSALRRRALKGNRRLIDRRKAIDDVGKRPVLANMAIARKLACWCWAVGRMVESAA